MITLSQLESVDARDPWRRWTTPWPFMMTFLLIVEVQKIIPIHIHTTTTWASTSPTSQGTGSANGQSLEISHSQTHWLISVHLTKLQVNTHGFLNSNVLRNLVKLFLLELIFILNWKTIPISKKWKKPPTIEALTNTSTHLTETNLPSSTKQVANTKTRSTLQPCQTKKLLMKSLLNLDMEICKIILNIKILFLSLSKMRRKSQLLAEIYTAIY